MKKTLSLYETRVIGVLLEKQITTPDYYPMSANALLNACNQKSNRNPVLSLDESALQATLADLEQKRLVKGSAAGSRVIKYQHRFCNTEFGELKLDDQEVAVLCELFLRGPQTPGELRSRAGRMAQFNDVEAVDATLERLMKHHLGPLVKALPKEPGKREARYGHLFSGEEETQITATVDSATLAGYKAKVDELQNKLKQLEEENQMLKQRLRQLGEVV